VLVLLHLRISSDSLFYCNEVSPCGNWICFLIMCIRLCLAKQDLSSLDQAMLKQIYGAVAALLLEAAKLDKDAAAVRCQNFNT